MPTLTSMATCKIYTTHSPFIEYRFQQTIKNRNRNGLIKVSVKLSEKNVKANLCASRKERIKIPNYGDGDSRIYDISHFLNDSSGIEAILNAKALQTFGGSGECVSVNWVVCFVMSVILPQHVFWGYYLFMPVLSSECFAACLRAALAAVPARTLRFHAQVMDIEMGTQQQQQQQQHQD